MMDYTLALTSVWITFHSSPSTQHRHGLGSGGRSRRGGMYAKQGDGLRQPPSDFPHPHVPTPTSLSSIDHTHTRCAQQSSHRCRTTRRGGPVLDGCRVLFVSGHRVAWIGCGAFRLSQPLPPIRSSSHRTIHEKSSGKQQQSATHAESTL